MSLLAPNTMHKTVASKPPAVKRGSFRLAGPRAIRARLAERGMTVTSLARELGWTRDYVSMTIFGDRVGRKAQRRIARALGMRMDRAFPGEGA